LAAAKEAGIAVSPLVKAPADRASGGSKKKAKPSATPLIPINPVTQEQLPASKTPRPPRDGMVAIPIPIYGGSDGVIYLPGDMTAKQWTNVIKMTEFILQNYRETMSEQVAVADAEEGDDI
jgi:hypothetical protein